MFFAKRRRQKEYSQAHNSNTNHALDSELLTANQSHNIKRIKGSYDIFALTGKEEFIRLGSWPDQEVVKEPNYINNDGFAFDGLSNAATCYATTMHDIRETLPISSTATENAIGFNDSQTGDFKDHPVAVFCNGFGKSSNSDHD